MSIEEFKMARLHNEEHFQFHGDVIGVSEKLKFDTTGLGPHWSGYLGYYGDETKVMEVVRKSAYTRQLVEADRSRDELIRGFTLQVEAAAVHYLAEKKQAGIRLKIIFDNYGNIAYKSNDKATADLTSLYSELSKNHMNDLTLLDLTGWLDEMLVRNNNFIAISNARYSEDAEKTMLKMNQVRQDVDESYRKVIEFVNAKITLGEESVYSDFVKEVSLRIKHYRALIAQHKSHKSNGESQEPAK